MRTTKTQNKRVYGSKRWLLTLLATVLLLPGLSLKAQVTVGAGYPPQDFSILEVVSNGTGGLRLPRLDNDQRKKLTDSQTFKDEIIGKGKGLTIYNISINCVEYWNGTKWISLCSGNTAFKGGECAETPIAATGGSASCTITDPNCDTEGEYTFTFVTGSDYASIVVTDAGAGAFTLTFEANDQASDRQAIVMVTSPCGTSSMLVFTQKGDDAGCGVTTVPAIKVVGDVTAMCGNGAAYLYLDGYPTTGTFIWTLNGQQVGTGYNYTATTSGKYIVYGDKIGCPNNQSIQITLDGTGAPNPVQLIVVGNNGIACGVGGTVKLITSAPASGTIIWFCDGKLTNKTGAEIDATKGFWEAVVQDGTCYSTPSEGVTITENPDGGSITPPVIKINGLTSGWKLCRGGSLFLEVGGTMEPGVTYTWYADNTQIGTGTGIYYPVPSSEQVVIRLRATGTGCAQEALTVETVSIDQAPGAPFISCNTPGNALCGGQATLSATGGVSYIWFKDGQVIAGQTGSSLAVTQTGSYTASAVSAGGCQSVQSGATVISTSDFATLSWVSHPATANIGDTKTYSVSLDFPQSATYTWTVTGGTITNGQGTTSVTVNFPSATAATVTCEATNACGTALDSPLTQNVSVTTGCTDARITGTSNLTSSVTASNTSGNTTALSVTATGTGLTYQWYEGTVSGGIGSGSPIAGETAAGFEYKATASTPTGPHTFYCVVTPSGGCAAATSQQFTVTVKPDLDKIPLGTGTFTGKTCFDIAYSNDNVNNCAPLSSRTGNRTDFSLTTPQDPASASSTPYTGTQVYTFTPSGAVSNVRFEYKDPSGKVVASMTPNGTYTGNIASGTACKVTVVYKPALNTDLKGLTRANALTAQLYAVYNNASGGAGDDVAVKINLTLQDCACCGAATVDGGWLTFMCHNLGVDQSLDPFTPNRALFGDYYQWGQNTTDYVSSRYGDATAWGDGNTYSTSALGSTFLNPKKGPKDPCPAGWKVPSASQWMSIFRGTTASGGYGTATANKWTPLGTFSTSTSNTGGGYMVGDNLFLPAGGYRAGVSSYSHVGSSGYYWSSTIYNSTYSYSLAFSSSNVLPAANDYRNLGRAVRCVAE